MAKPKVIRVFEHDRLTTQVDYLGRSITKRQREQLYAFNDQHGHKYFTGIRNGVKFKSQVGVLQIGRLTIEILPKADKISISNEQDLKAQSAKWRNVLLQMLDYTGGLRIDSFSQAQLERRQNSLLELYLEQFLNELDQLIRRGLIKQYRTVTSNQLALKGRLHFPKHLRYNVVHKELFYVQHAEYDHSHFINQVLWTALEVLEQVSSLRHADVIKRLKSSFPVIERATIDRQKLDTFKLNRKNEAYRKAYQIAKMLLLNYAPSLSSGSESMLALLFDMNLLWEKYILKSLQRLNQSEYQISGRNSETFWRAEGVNRPIKPDIVLKNNGDGSKTIIDTKWKIVESLRPSDKDLKQMYAYNMYWDAPRSLLLYPHVGQVERDPGIFIKGRYGRNECGLAFAKVLNSEGKLNMTVGPELIEKLK